MSEKPIWPRGTRAEKERKKSGQRPRKRREKEEKKIIRPQA